jgi:hypothetical protein
MEKITADELRGKKVIDFRKEGGKLILTLEGLGERVVACEKCGNTEFSPNKNLKMCGCGNSFFVFYAQK